MEINQTAANSAVNSIISAAYKQEANARTFASKIGELNLVFKGAVAEKFMRQATDHVTDLATVTSDIMEIGSGLNSITNRAVKNAEEAGRGGI